MQHAFGLAPASASAQAPTAPLVKVLVIPLLFGLAACGGLDDPMTVTSPDGTIVVTVWVDSGQPYYRATVSGADVILPSRLGFTIEDDPDFGKSFAVKGFEHSFFDETWEQVWGEKRFVRNTHNQLRFSLEESEAPHRRLDIVFRVFDDGLGFRYEFPDQDALRDFEISDELTEFALAGDHTSWWIPAYRNNRYEYLYTESSLSEVDTVHTPFTLSTADGLYLSFHEANLTDFPSMTLAHIGGKVLKADLIPWADGTRAKVTAPHVSPWRTIQIARKAADLITSYLILNLNEPNRIEDTSWITPGKYAGIWWGMHIQTMTWESGPLHGATTENAKRYIDFAAENGFLGVLVEGWNIGWDGDWFNNGNVFSFTEPYSDFDIEEVASYALSKGVRLIGHHETSTGVLNYERQIEDAFDLYDRLGVNAVKTGYVGDRVDGGEPHHGQFMVRHFRRVVELAARKGIMLDVHEPIKDTGIRRTWPNMMTREGARGMEYNAWGSEGGNPPEHTTILAFTRMLSGPFDMTPGIFDHDFETRPDNIVPTTIARQLAYYVVIYSPLQMVADLPENYEGHPAFKFILDVPVDWEDTVVPAAAIGDYVVIARKDRNSDDWYLGAVTDENERTLQLPLTFLDHGRSYTAEIYLDGPDADYRTNQTDVMIEQKTVTRDTVLDVRMAPGGGQAVRLVPEDAS